MNRFKKLLLLLCVAASLCLCLVACQDENNSTTAPTQPRDGIYTIRVSTPSGVLPKGLTVYVYRDETKQEMVKLGALDGKGEFTFTDQLSDRYVAVIEGLPEEGYDLQESYRLTGMRTEIVLKTAVVQGKEPTDKVYQLGDVMRDFTVTTTDGRTLRISQLLEEKNAVVLHFWHTKSQSCKNELLQLQQAYALFGDKVELIAMNSMQGDTEGQVSLFQMENALTFPVAKVDQQWERAMRVTSYPTTVVIDRYGVICLMHVGPVNDNGLLAGLLAHFAADDYQQKLIKDIGELQPFEYPVGSQNNPFETSADTGAFQATVAPNGEYHVKLFNADGLTLHIENPNAYIIYQNVRYDPNEEGIIEVLLSAPDAQSAAYLIVGNNTDQELSVLALLKAAEEVPLGNILNPFPLELGKMTVNVEEGNDQGVYYSVTAQENGYLKVAITNAPTDVLWEVQLCNLTTMTQRNLTEENLVDKDGNLYVLVAVRKGDVIRVGFQSQPDENGVYPAVTMEAEVTLADQAEAILYVVTFHDEEGNPMPGVSITVTVDGVLTTFTSDEEGRIVMNLPPNNYSIRVNVPEGYTCATTQYLLTASNPSRDITLQVYVAQEKTYTVYVVDQDGNPVADAFVAVGDRFERTDANGVVRFVMLEGSYSATVIAPAGYLSDNNSYPFGNRTSMTIVLTRDTQAQYTVTVLDCQGRPFTDVLVSFSGTNVMSRVDASGKVNAMLNRGTYQVVLLFGSNVMGYDTATAVVTEDQTSIVIEVAPYADGAFEAISPDGRNTSGQYLSLGGSFVQLTAEGRTYFLFAPQQTGVYEITTSNPGALLENWNTLEETTKVEAGVDNNVLTLTVREENMVFVFAVVDSGDVDATIIKLRRTGDVPVEPEVSVFQGSMTPTIPYQVQLQEGQTVQYLDLTQQYNLVRDENGFYHLGDVSGQLVMVNLHDSRFGVSISQLLEQGTMLGNTYDEEGNLIGYVDFAPCMANYFTCCDPELGVYALTDDLITMLQSYGDAAGWFDPASENYLFGEQADLNPDSLWMFLLCVAV